MRSIYFRALLVLVVSAAHAEDRHPDPKHGAETAVDSRVTGEELLQPEQNVLLEVLGEDRSLPISGGRFEDDFPAYAVHLYRIYR